MFRKLDFPQLTLPRIGLAILNRHEVLFSYTRAPHPHSRRAVLGRPLPDQELVKVVRFSISPSKKQQMQQKKARNE